MCVYNLYAFFPQSHCGFGLQNLARSLQKLSWEIFIPRIWSREHLGIFIACKHIFITYYSSCNQKGVKPSIWNVLQTSQREYSLQNKTKKFQETVEICFFSKKKESHISWNKYLDINVDGLEHYEQPTDLPEQAN